MPRKLSEVQQDAGELPLKDRAALVEHLLTTLDSGDDVEAEELWLREAEQRHADYISGKIVSTPAEEVFQEANKRLR